MENKKAQYFLLHNKSGEIEAVVSANPEHELTQNQIEISWQAYTIIKSIPHTVSLDQAIQILLEVGQRIKENVQDSSG